MSQQDRNYVPCRDHYSLEYLRGGRLSSYAHQIETVISFEPITVLEIGVGGGVVTAAMRAAGLSVTTLDVQPDLRPDIFASVTQIPTRDKSFDVALCSQVLEHLPFSHFEPALKELRRVIRRGVVISLPDASPYYEIKMRLPKFRNLCWTVSRHRDPGRKWKDLNWARDGHYWEIGYDETPLAFIRDAIGVAGFDITHTWRVSGYPYHRFFRLRPCD